MLVITNIIATDKNGNAVDGLGPEDFRVTEDDAVQRINIFEFQRVPQDGGKSYYILGYYTPNTEPAGQYRRIKVTVNRSTTAKIEYRPGYYARPTFVPNPSDLGDPPRVSSVPLDDVVPARLIHKEEPEYSEEARKAKWQGTVTLHADIDEAGNVTDVHLVNALGLGLDEKAIAVVKKWKFKPAEKDGKPVASQASVDVTFRLL